MATIKSYTDISQSKKLAEFLPLESVDMYWDFDVQKKEYYPMIMDDQFDDTCIRAWSLAALLEYMNRNFYKISINYCGSEYTISFGNGERYKTITKDYSIDAAFEMVCWLKENNKL